MPTTDRPITTNDRQFTCDTNHCSLFANVNSSTVFDREDGLFRLNFTIFNTNTIQTESDLLMVNAKRAIDAYLNWLDGLERKIEVQINMNVIKLTEALFNQINLLVSKAKNGRKNIRTWYSNFLNDMSDLTDYILQYSEAVAKIESINIQTKTQTSLPLNVVTIAKQNITKSRSIERQITKILSIETKIRNLIQQVSFRMKELESGIFKIPKGNEFTTFNINELAEALKELNIRDSPLQRIQTQLSEMINTTPVSYAINTAPITNLNNALIEPLIDRLNQTEFDGDYFLKQLQKLQNNVLYTENTRNQLEQVFEYIDKYGKNSPNYDALQSLIENIKENNAPHIMILDLNSRASQSENIYLVIQKINNILDNLNPKDIMYRDRLKEIHQEATKTAKNLIKNQLNLETVNLETENSNLLPTSRIPLSKPSSNTFVNDLIDITMPTETNDSGNYNSGTSIIHVESDDNARDSMNIDNEDEDV